MSSAPDNPFQSPEAPLGTDATLTALQQKLRETPLTFVELASISWWALREQLGTFAIILVMFYGPLNAVHVFGQRFYMTQQQGNRHYTRR